MAIPGAGNNTVPSRTLLEATGAGLVHPEVSTKAQYPSIALATTQRLVPIAIDEQFVDSAVYTPPAGAGAFRTGAINVTFPNIPVPLYIPAGETLSFTVSVSAMDSHSLGLGGFPVIGSPKVFKVVYLKSGIQVPFKISSILFTYGGVPYANQTGELPLPAGETVISWGCQVGTTVYFPDTLSGNGFVRFYCVATLWDSPGH